MKEWVASVLIDKLGVCRDNCRLNELESACVGCSLNSSLIFLICLERNMLKYEDE